MVDEDVADEESAEETEIVDTDEVDAPAAEIPQETIVAAEKNATPVRPSRMATREVKAPTSIGEGIKDASVGGLSLSDRAEMTKQRLAKEPKVGIIIPLEQGEKQGAVKTVNINGYRFEIMKNTFVQLPKSVFEVLAHSMKASVTAKTAHPLNLSNAPEDRKAALG